MLTLLQLGVDLQSGAPGDLQLLEPAVLFDVPIERLEQYQAASHWVMCYRQFIDVADDAIGTSQDLGERVNAEIASAQDRRAAALHDKVTAFDENARQQVAQLDDQIADLEESQISGEAPSGYADVATADDGTVGAEAGSGDWLLAGPRNARDFHASTLDATAQIVAASQTQRDLLDVVQALWTAKLALVLDSRRRRAKARRTRARVRAAAVVALALIVVLVGVAADLALSYTPAAGVLASAILALALWITYERYVSPRIKRAERVRLIQDLQEDIADCTEALMKIRSREGRLRARAQEFGVSCPSLLGEPIYRLAESFSTNIHRPEQTD